jgi:hypothetical protein
MGAKLTGLGCTVGMKILEFSRLGLVSRLLKGTLCSYSNYVHFRQSNHSNTSGSDSCFPDKSFNCPLFLFTTKILFKTTRF